MQIAARVLEVAMHKAHELHFPLEHIEDLLRVLLERRAAADEEALQLGIGPPGLDQDGAAGIPEEIHRLLRLRERRHDDGAVGIDHVPHGDRMGVSVLVEAGQDDRVGLLEKASLLRVGEGDGLASLHDPGRLLRTPGCGNQIFSLTLRKRPC